MRTIQEVKVESESRAVVIANIRNTTPIPAGAQPDKYDTERREHGELFRYVLEKSGTSWQIAEVYMRDELRLYGGDWRKILPITSDYVPSTSYDAHSI